MLQAGTWSAALLSVGCCRPLPISPIKSDSLAGLWDDTGVVALTKQLTVLGWGGALNASHELAFSTSGAVPAGGGAMWSVGSCAPDPSDVSVFPSVVRVLGVASASP